VGKEAALVFSTGYQVNLGVISCLVGRGDVVVADKDDHASIVDGCMLALGEMRRFSHNDLDHLDRVLAKLEPDVGRMVVVDGVYSMGGDLAPLPELVEICKRHSARLMVDDAHSIGVMGRGRGTAAHYGVTDQVDLIMGTFSKSFASLGGFIAGDESVIHFIQHNARSLIFSASMPASNVAAVLAALDIMGKRAGVGRPPVAGHRADAHRPQGPGLPHGPQLHPHHPHHHRGDGEDLPGLEDVL
jgi:7-keto-8-aminopelargonate synthetase-like enzyme